MLEPILQESHLLTLEAYVDSISKNRPYKLPDGIMDSSGSEMCDNYVSIYDYNKSLKLTLSQVAIHRGCVNDKGEPQIAGLFVPVGPYGELLEEPLSIYYTPEHGLQKHPQECYTHDLEAYQQAKERMLFKMDLKVVKVKPNQCILEGNEDRKNFLMSPETTLSELAQATDKEPLEILKR